MAFERIHLAPGEERLVEFVIPASAFSYINEEGEAVYAPGQFELSVGGGQPHQKIKASSNVLTTSLMLEI